MMKRTGILTIGSELLVGHVLNTHAQYLTKLLNHIGYSVYYHMTCGDNEERIHKAISLLREQCDLIIITGGLGPTQDDMTREVVAKALNLELVKDESTVKKLTDFFISIDRPMTENNFKQAYFPKGAEILNNPKGTAPGFIVSDDTLKIACLPGPPQELYAVAEGDLLDSLTTDGKLYSKYINLYGIGESAVDEKISDIFENQSDPSIGIYALGGMLSLRVSTVKRTNLEAENVLMPIVHSIKNRLIDYVFSTEGETLAEVVVKKLDLLHKKLTFAESCTGGNLAKGITDISGASNVFDSSLVTYSNQEKTRLLGVSPQTLESHGAVSEETAKEMVMGLKSATGADLCVAVTGIAGPSGGTEDKPVGLVYIGYSLDGRVQVEKHHFHGTRENIRLRTTQTVYMQINRYLEGCLQAAD
ncbi:MULTISPECIES: competence/damage-inducible protein A [unclassified Fusibacter]|uniref:competence/damage-inducible protein A n=1 Tax=unclassified Fusibacter TaxID=2624464 RepID=UPI001011BBA4|nr:MULTISPECIES: competence/damage-inducible protein A [unclassified Fusibacter]MCK8058857.1 competence/damage-inducible protein A [Fusibacter sp. A2]NPE21931.1 competence/damage-inducible protein A [Fusibacter sp. A1]RXV61501.1 competence/damage-inducible protein A [Fusibacter sp. A1]